VSDLNDLKTLDCSSNDIAVLDVSANTALQSLSCGANSLAALDVSNNVALTTLNCNSNVLTVLDVSENAALIHFHCDNNSLTGLDVSNNTALEILNCSGCELNELDVSSNTTLEELYCGQNNLTTLEVSNLIDLRLLSLGRNQLSNLDISNLTDFFLPDGSCGCEGYLDLSNMPTLKEVCVWVTPFPPPDNAWQVYTGGSPDIYFHDCAAPELTISGPSYQPVFIEATSTEDGKIYLVPENTTGSMESILADSINSVLAIANDAVSISCDGLENGVYWLYATDMEENISIPEAFSIKGVGFDRVLEEQCRIYPNPTNAILTLESKSIAPLSIEITSLNGQQIFSTNTIGTQNTIDLTSFQKGSYIIIIKSKDFVTTRKIIKL